MSAGVWQEAEEKWNVYIDMETFTESKLHFYGSCLVTNGSKQILEI